MSVKWIDVEYSASKMFNVWASGGDFEWAREAWEHLSKAGLTEEFENLDRTLVNLRLVALANIYHDFCSTKWDENPDLSFSELSEYVEINPLTLGLFVGSNSSSADWEIMKDELNLRELSLTTACELLRPDIVECLSNAYGGTTGLYIRLSMTQSGGSDDDDAEYVQDSSADALDATGPSLEAHALVTQGFRK